MNWLGPAFTSIRAVDTARLHRSVGRAGPYAARGVRMIPELEAFGPRFITPGRSMPTCSTTTDEAALFTGISAAPRSMAILADCEEVSEISLALPPRLVRVNWGGSAIPRADSARGRGSVWTSC